MKSCIFQEDDTGVSDIPEGVVASRGPKPSAPWLRAYWGLDVLCQVPWI